MKLSHLPQDIIHYILSYNGKIKYRNGKYMNQICKEDKRYKLLLKIPPIKSNKIYKNVYETFIIGHVYDEIVYKDTNTELYIDLKKEKVIYIFCYDFENNPEIYHLWIRY